MKKIILGVAAFFSLAAFNLNAQDGIEIRLNGTGPDISGTTYFTSLYATSPDIVSGTFEVHFDVTNNTGTDQQWKITRKHINVPSTWVDQICWPPSCYPTSGSLYSTPNSGLNPAPTIVNGTATTAIILPNYPTSLVAEMKPRITPDPATASSAHYRYYITSVSTGEYMDSIDVTLDYVLGVSTLKQTPAISVSPNPASENVNVTLGSTENGSIRVVDVLGNTVYAETITNGQKTINVEDFKNGVYFIMIEGPGIKINRKLIVRH